MTKTFKWVCGCGVALSVVFGLIALCRSWCSTSVTIDYMGIIVGILSLLVTTLIGWNIYNLIDLRKEKEILSRTIETMSLLSYQNKAINHHDFWMVYHYLVLHKDPAGLDYRFLQHGILSAANATQANDVTTANAILKGLLECVTPTSKITMSEHSKNELLTLTTTIKPIEGLEGYHDLIQRILNIQVGNRKFFGQ